MAPPPRRIRGTAMLLAGTAAGVVTAALGLCAPIASAFIPHALVISRPSSSSSLSSSTRSSLFRYATSTPTPPPSSPLQRSQTKYIPKGWDREMYRPPDEVLFEWQELLCCLKFMEEKDVNAGMLAPETRDMMIGYADTLIKNGSPVRTLEGLAEAMKGRWKLAFTTEESPFSKAGKQWKLPLPQNVGNLGTAFADVSYMDGVIWIEKIRDPATQSVFVTIYEYVGPLAGEERSSLLSLTSSASSKAAEVTGLASSTQSLVSFLEGLEREEQEELVEKNRKEEEGEGKEERAGAAETESSPSSKVSA
ncbi:Hypothetical protein NocV09_02100670 [Nannochloropsis oceanica]